MVRACLALVLVSSACTTDPASDGLSDHPLQGAWSGVHLEFLSDGATLELPWVLEHPSEPGRIKAWTFELAVQADGHLSMTEAMTTMQGTEVTDEITCVLEGQLTQSEDGAYAAHLPGPSDPDAELPCLTLDASCVLASADSLECTFTTPQTGTFAGLDASRYEQIITFEPAIAVGDTAESP